MSNKETKELIDFFTIVQKGIKKHGVEKIVMTIQSIELEDNNVYFNEIHGFIIKLVCKEFLVTIRQLTGMEKRGKVTTARKMAIILISEHLDISDEQISKFFKRVRQVVCHTLKEYNSFDRSKKIDQPFFEVYDRLNLLVKNRIEELTGKTKK